MGKMFYDKVCVVIGVGCGIGCEIVLFMVCCGVKVVVNDFGGLECGDGFEQMLVVEVVVEIEVVGGSVVVNYESVVDLVVVKCIIEQVMDMYGQFDCVVNNVGILCDVIFYKMIEDDWDVVINVYFKGSFNMSFVVVLIYWKQIGGCFVYMILMLGLIGNFGQVNYVVVKFGIVGLLKLIVFDMSCFEVCFNCILLFVWS